MATASNAELVAGLHEQVLLGIKEAAESDRLLASRDFGPLGFVACSSNWLCQQIVLLPPKEKVVLGLRFGVGAPGVDRASVALLLRLPVDEVARLERLALVHLLLAEEL